MPKPGSVISIATNANYSTGDRVGSPTKIAIIDVPNGFVPGTPVTSEQINFALNLAGQWQVYSRDMESAESLTWLLSQAFRQALTLGAGWLGSAGEGLLPRWSVRIPGAGIASRCGIGDVRLQSSPIFGTFGPWITFYSLNVGDNDQSYEVALNCTYDGSAWSKRVAGQAAALFRFKSNVGIGSAAFTVFVRAASSGGTWDDGANTTTGWNAVVARFGQPEGIFVSGPWLFTPGTTVWGFTPPKPSQLTSSTEVITLCIDHLLPPWPVRITQARLYVAPVATGRAGLPATKPGFSFTTVNRSTGALANPAGSGTMVDPSASVGAYETYHEIDSANGTVNGSGTIFSAFNTNPAELSYTITARGEQGTNFVAGLTVAGLRLDWDRYVP